MSKKLAIETTIYSHTFFNEISSNGSFHVLEHLPAGLFLLTNEPGTFDLPESDYVLNPWTVFTTRTLRGKTIFVNIFLLKHASPYPSDILFLNFTWFAFLSQQRTRSTVWFVAILNSLKTIFLEIKTTCH